VLDLQQFLCPYRYHFAQLGNRSHNNALLFLQCFRNYRFHNLGNDLLVQKPLVEHLVAEKKVM
jgi:hypothetical protein